MNCPLCSHPAKPYFEDPKEDRRYFHCTHCDLRFLDPAHHLSPAEEKLRYELHENDVNDVRYLNYMRPIADWIEGHCEPKSTGLDFGCGEGPALTQILESRGFTMRLYDPYYFTDTSYKNSRYDFCVAVEAAEHFYHPLKEFTHLKNCLNPKGALGIVTQLYRPTTDFASWYYRLDPTHVCFYSTTTFEWLRQELGFSIYQSDGTRLNWFS
jgi:Methyltransferase domain